MRFLRFALPGVVLLAVSSAAATQTTPQPAPPAASGPSVPGRNANAAQSAPSAQPTAGESNGERANRALNELRQTLWRDVLSQYPPSVGRSVQQKPLLLSSDDFLARYPALDAFLKEHPEVRLNQGFFFPALPRGTDNSGGPGFGGTLIAILIPLGFFSFLLGAAFLAHRQSAQRAKARQETQNRVLDQLLAREDLTSYLATPAGRRLLESVMEPGDSRRLAATSRVIRAVQGGVVMVTIGLGFFILSPIVGLEGRALWFFKVVPTIFGTGFLLSAGATYLLSRRFGLIQTPDTRD